MKLVFKSNKKKQIKLKFFNTSSYPKRSQNEWKLIDKNPFGDTDKDRVPNWFDCKPLNKKKQGKNLIMLYHGTTPYRAKKIKEEGFRPDKSKVGRVHFIQSLTDPYEGAEGHGTKILKVKLPISMAHFESAGVGHNQDGDIIIPDINIEKYKNLSGKRKMNEYKEFISPKEEYVSTEVIISEKLVPKEYLVENYPQKEKPETLQSLEDTKPIEIKDED